MVFSITLKSTRAKVNSEEADTSAADLKKTYEAWLDKNPCCVPACEPAAERSSSPDPPPWKCFENMMYSYTSSWNVFLCY